MDSQSTWCVRHKPSPTYAPLRNVLRAEARKASDLARITPPGLDEVSADAVRIMVDAAVGEQGSLRLALLGAADRFENDANKLEASLRTHLRADEISIPKARELKFGAQL